MGRCNDAMNKPAAPAAYTVLLGRVLAAAFGWLCLIGVLILSGLLAHLAVGLLVYGWGLV